MRTEVLNPENKKELKSALTSCFGGYNYFKGTIRKENKYVVVNYWFNGNSLVVELTYWEDGKDCAVDYASHCSSVTGVVSKVSKFLNLK